MRVTHNRKQKYISTGIMLYPHQWDNGFSISISVFIGMSLKKGLPRFSRKGIATTQTQNKTRQTILVVDQNVVSLMYH